MKCEFCGGDINIEQAYCTHCGKPNKYYEAHRQDMASYEMRFKKTEEDVTIKAGLLGKKAVFITIVAILVALICAEIAVIVNIDDINYSLEKRNNNKNAKRIAAELGRLEEEQDFLEFYDYYNKYSYGCHDETVRNYNSVSAAASSYHTIHRICVTLASGDTKYDAPYSLASRINSALSEAYDCVKSGENRPNDERYSPKHMEAMNTMIDQMHAYVSVYLKIDPEVVKTFPDMTDTQRFNVINERLEEVMADEN